MTIRKLGLTLVLLLSCFASAPFGSMEQAPEGVPVVSFRSLPAVQSVVGVRLDDLYTQPDQHAPSSSYDLHFPLLGALISGGVAGSLISGPVLGLPTRTLPPRICERLPYDATAPPSLA